MPDTSLRNSLALPLSTDGGNAFYNGLHTSLETIDAAIAKCNFAGGAIDPDADNDEGEGYATGSKWHTDTAIWECVDPSEGEAVWVQTWPVVPGALSITNAQLAGSISQDKLAGGILNSQLATADGWIAGPTLTYASADAPTYTITCSGDYSAVITPGMRIKLTDSTVKYFIVTKVSYSSPYTTITVYGGTDYTLSGGVISSPYYSMLKAPAGFPMDPAKWTVAVTDSTQRTQASPSSGTWYNIGSISISLPIGAWVVKYKCIAQISVASAWIDMFVSLSTSNNSESNALLTDKVYLNTLVEWGWNATMFANVVVTSKTVYYLIAKKTSSTANNIEFRNEQSDAVITAICAYM